MYASNDPNTVMQFSTERWKKSKSHQPSDAVEMSMFLRENPSIQVAIDHMTPQVSNTIGNQLGYEQLINGFSSIFRKYFWQFERLDKH